MKADEVFVVFNKMSQEIVYVAAEMFLAQRQCEKIATSGVTSELRMFRKDNFVVCTLQRAIDEINQEHLATIEDLRTEIKTAEKWNMY